MVHSWAHSDGVNHHMCSIEWDRCDMQILYIHSWLILISTVLHKVRQLLGILGVKCIIHMKLPAYTNATHTTKS